MKIAIIGASAGVGLMTTQRALEQGHTVVTLSRHTDAIPDHPQLRKVQGSATNRADVQTALEGAEAILVTLGTGNSLKATTLYTDAAQVLLQTLQDNGRTPPLLVLTGFGAGDSAAYFPFIVRLFFNLVLKRTVYANKSDMERMIATSYDQWEIVRPGQLTDGRMTGQYRVLDTLVRGMKVKSISRADVAHFLVTQAEQPTYIGKYPALTY